MYSTRTGSTIIWYSVTIVPAVEHYSMYSTEQAASGKSETGAGEGGEKRDDGEERGPLPPCLERAATEKEEPSWRR